MILFRATNKKNGTISEWSFCIACEKHEISLYKTTTEYTCSDFISDYKSNLKRIQVRSCSFEEKTGNSYKFSACAGGNSYKTKLTKKDTDFIAAHIVSHDLWYIVPVDKIKGKGFRLNPGLETNKYECYREKWDLLKE